MPEMPEIVLQMIRNADHIHLLRDGKRARLAVTHAEYEVIRQYCLTTEGRFFGTIRGTPLVLDEHPHDPLLRLEYAPENVA